jgi:hypothetical protein
MMKELKVMIIAKTCDCCSKKTISSTPCSLCGMDFCRDDIRITPASRENYAICRFCARHIIREWTGSTVI